MKVVIIGAGRRGLRLASHLIEERAQVVFIDSSSESCFQAQQKLDCLAVCGSATDIDCLREAGCESADAVISVTESDETNLVSCGLVSSQFPQVKKTIATIRSASYLGLNKLDNAILGISHIVNPEQEAAERIIGIIDTGVFRGFAYFADAEFLMFTRRITKDGPFAGKTLVDIKREMPGSYVFMGIRRKGKVFTPYGPTIIREGDDVVILVDEDEDSGILQTITDKQEGALKSIVLVGGSRISRYILLSLPEKRRKNVTLVEEDLEICNQFVSDFPDLLVLNGAITDEMFWDAEKLGEADLVISLTDNDELNIIVASYAKRQGCRHSISLVKTNSAYVSLAESMDIDAAIYTADATVDTLMKYLRGEDIRSLHTTFNGDLEVYEYTVPEDFKYINQALKNVNFKGRLIIAGVKRPGGSNFVPDGNYAFTKGDTILVAAAHRDYVYVQDLFK